MTSIFKLWFCRLLDGIKVHGLSTILLMPVLVLLGCGDDPSEITSKEDQEMKAEDVSAEKRVKVFPVKTIKVNTGFIESRYEVQGRLSPLETMMVTSETDGKIKSLLVKEGQRVFRGDLILELMAPPDEEFRREKLVLNIEKVDQRLTRQRELVRVAPEAIAAVDLEKDDFLKRELLIDLKKIDEEAKQRKVYAAYDGVLSGLNVQLGQRLTAQTQIAELMDDSKLELDLWIPEQQVAVIKLGMSANVILASSNASAMAKVIRLPNLIDESNGSGMITVSISPRPRDWQVGAFARVVFTLDKVGPNMLVPKRCVKYERNRPFVWIAHPEDDRLMAKKVWVSTGDSDDEFMIIKKGLKEEDQVIIEGLRQLSEGLSLEILPQAEEQ